MKLTLSGLFLVLFSAQVACAHQGLLKGSDLSPVTLPEALTQVQPGDVVVIGENHGFKNHQSQQIEIMKQLRQNGLIVSVGMEFFYYPDQPLVSDWKAGTLAEADFLKAIKWGSPSFDYYRDQALFPLAQEGGQTWALNAPRSLTGSVAKVGVEGLSPELKAMLPPQFEVGRDSYRQRFLALMPHIPNPAAGERYFQAQSVWDDTMAWRAVEFMKANPQHVLVIVVGEFHVQFGGGLPDRLKARGLQRVWTFSQVNSEGMSASDLEKELQPSPAEGPRADYLWVEIAKP